MTNETDGSGDDLLTEEESLAKLRAGCNGCTDDTACCAISGLLAHGWKISFYEGREQFSILLRKFR